MIGDCLELEPSGQPAGRIIGAARVEPFDASEGGGISSAISSGELELSGEPAGTRVSQMAAAGKESEPFIVSGGQEIPSVILFRFDSADIDAQWRDNLEQLGRFIIARDPAKIIVEGHADWIGTDEYNIGLSRRRAQAMVDYLISEYGLERDLFIIEPYGESRPVTSNETAAGRQKNRRAAASILFKIIPTTEISMQPAPE
jgi:outer membrane protein OmpA-like peptidoglycan-associated protein